MFEDLVTLNPADFVDEEHAAPRESVDAKYNTVELLTSLGVKPDEEVEHDAQKDVAQRAFAALTTNSSLPAQKLSVAALNAPTAVRHLVAMLTAYDWQFVEQAQELRGYAVSQILEETKSDDKRHRLKALELLGKVTEVALFTERVEIKKTDLSEAELEAKIREKLGRVINVEYQKTEERADE
jgi:hypothetical protein